MKIKGRPTWLFGIVAIIILSAVGKYDFLHTQLWPWDIIKWLVVPFFFLTLINLCAKKYQEIDDLKGIIQQRKNKDKVVLQIEAFLKKCEHL